MSSLVSAVYSAGSQITSRLSDLAVDLTGTRPHNIIDPCSSDSVIRKPSIPLCTSIPGGQLEEGTLIGLIATANPSFSKRFRIDFIVEKCDHPNRSPCCTKASHAGHRHGDQRDSGPNAPTSAAGDRGSTSQVDQTDKGSRTSLDGMNIAFHFNPRFSGMTESEQVVMNSMFEGKWCEEIRSERFPFTVGKTFKLMILVEKDAFKIAVDGKHYFEYKHLCDFKDIGRIHIEGNITVELMEFRKELKYLSRSSSSCSSASAASSTSASDVEIPPIPSTSNVRSRTVSSPNLPYRETDNRLSGKIYNIYIAGLMPNNFHRNFVLNLLNSKAARRTIPFHMSIRPDQQMIVRNTMDNGDWSAEEELYLEGPFPFVLGTHFDLMLCHKPDKISVAVNGQMAFEWKNRMDPAQIDTVEISGSPLITSVRYEFF